jgi:hypothetical protein
MSLSAEVPEDFGGWAWLALHGLLAIDYNKGHCRIRMLNEE